MTSPFLNTLKLIFRNLKNPGFGILILKDRQRLVLCLASVSLGRGMLRLCAAAHGCGSRIAQGMWWFLEGWLCAHCVLVIKGTWRSGSASSVPPAQMPQSFFSASNGCVVSWVGIREGQQCIAWRRSPAGATAFTATWILIDLGHGLSISLRQPEVPNYSTWKAMAETLISLSFLGVFSQSLKWETGKQNLPDAGCRFCNGPVAQEHCMFSWVTPALGRSCCCYQQWQYCFRKVRWSPVKSAAHNMSFLKDSGVCVPLPRALCEGAGSAVVTAPMGFWIPPTWSFGTSCACLWEYWGFLFFF